MKALYWSAVTALMIPLALIVLTSVGTGPFVGFPLTGPSLRWYAEALADASVRRAVGLSVLLAGASALLAVCAGLWIALAVHALRQTWLRMLLFGGSLIPLVTPGIVHAIALRMTIQLLGFDPGPAAILLGHAIHATPYAVIMVAARRATLPPGLIDAAYDLGAGPARVFTDVVAPWLSPALIGAGLLAALSSFDDFIRSFFLGGYDPTLPVLLFARLRSSLTPEISAISTLVLMTVCSVWVFALHVSQRRSPVPLHHG